MSKPNDLPTGALPSNLLFQPGSLQNTVDSNCKGCRRNRGEFPMAFRNEDYCSDACRKDLGQGPPELNARY